MSRKLYMSSKLFVAVLLALTLVFSQAGITYASALDAKFTCEDNGGTWEGSSASTGTCTYPAGSLIAVNACGSANFIYTETYNSNVKTDTSCMTVVVVEETPPPYGDCGDLQEGQTEEGTTLTPCHSSGQSFVNFGEGNCSGSCRTSTTLPRDAANNLPSDALATLYVMVRDADGNPSNDSYTVCFGNPNGEELAIYRFVSGGWRLLVISSADPVCATASGDGAFYLAPVAGPNL